MIFSKRRIITFFLPLLFLLQFTLVFSQKRLEIGPAFGFSFYQGDVLGSNINEISRNIHFAGGVHAGYYFSDYFGVHLGLDRGKISGGDNFAENPERQKRNLSFESPITNLSIRVDWNITGYNPKEERNFSLYAFAGSGLLFFNPKAEYKDKVYRLQPLGTEGQGLKKYPNRQPYKLYTPTFDLGGGIKFALSEKWNAAVEFSVYRAFSDYLDDVAGYYVPYTDILEEKGDWIAAALSNRIAELEGSDQIQLAKETDGRGNQKVFDYTYIGSVKLTYNLYDPFGSKGTRRFSKFKSTKDCYKF